MTGTSGQSINRVGKKRWHWDGQNVVTENGGYNE